MNPSQQSSSPDELLRQMVAAMLAICAERGIASETADALVEAIIPTLQQMIPRPASEGSYYDRPHADLAGP